MMLKTENNRNYRMRDIKRSDVDDDDDNAFKRSRSIIHVRRRRVTSDCDEGSNIERSENIKIVKEDCAGRKIHVEIRKMSRKVGSDDDNDTRRRQGKRNLEGVPRFQKLDQGMTNLGKSGGVYIPPFKLPRMITELEDKSSMEYQRMTWDALRKSINGLVNKVNATNIKNIIPELFAENLIRGRGLFCRSCIKSQMASPGFTDVFAALVAVVNTKFHQVGDLMLTRILLQLQRAYKRNDKHQLLAAVKFIAHLVNQQELSEHLGIRLLNERLSDPTMQTDFESIFPRDNTKNTRFSINFFTSIGLGGITENLREYLKNMPRLIVQQNLASSESDDSSNESSSSESERIHKKSRRR